ncbi:hypothetical protein [Pseudoroseomonas sp. WGS1072]|uniref:hypothetical protein n=1 Tax=Roseomonas sp. WGS1072 TaxID=3366816 RepID=UPI003BF12ECC
MRRGRAKSIPKSQTRRPAEAAGEVARLRQELQEARALLRELAEGGGSVVAKRLASLEEERQIARGQAVEAAMAKSKAEGELRRLQAAIDKAPGFRGWLLRRARRRLETG